MSRRINVFSMSDNDGERGEGDFRPKAFKAPKGSSAPESVESSQQAAATVGPLPVGPARPADAGKASRGTAKSG